ncbi:hypothetical protein ACFL20_04495 [Spirochaetota bacterium]
MKLNTSTFTQAWLPCLESTDAEMTIESCLLKGEYKQVEPVKFNIRKCGACGSELRAIEDSKKMLCENCCYVIDVEKPEFKCTSCGVPLSFPVDNDCLKCPSCGILLSKLKIKPQDEADFSRHS